MFFSQDLQVPEVQSPAGVPLSVIDNEVLAKSKVGRTR
jgi:hypothetical protein